jgi:hypothetical protein
MKDTINQYESEIKKLALQHEEEIKKLKAQH